MSLQCSAAAALSMGMSAVMAQALTVSTAPWQATFHAWLSDSLFVDSHAVIASGDLFSAFPDLEHFLLFTVDTPTGVAPVFSAQLDMAGLECSGALHPGHAGLAAKPDPARRTNGQPQAALLSAEDDLWSSTSTLGNQHR